MTMAYSPQSVQRKLFKHRLMDDCSLGLLAGNWEVAGSRPV